MLNPQFFGNAIQGVLQAHHIFSDCDIILQRWSWGWKFYINMPHRGLVHLNLPDSQPGVAVISDLVVDQLSRRQGHGRRLLFLCEELARLLEADAIGLWADPEDWPIDWYQRHGYRSRGANPEVTPDIYLEKPLKPQK